MKRTLLLLFVLFGSAFVIAKDIRVVVLTTQPQMHCASCEKKIKENLRYLKGVKNIETNVEKQSVKVTYDADKTTVEKIKTSLKKIKYEAKVKD